MYVFVELWNAKPAWLALSAADRGAYLTQVGGAVQALAEAGIESLYWARNDAETARRAGYDYLAVWKMPDASAVAHFEATVEGAGWYDYFEQINARGESAGVEAVLGHMAQLG